MKAEIEIEIVNTELEKLGIDQESTFVKFRFDTSKFVGYWFTENSSSITFYISSMSFLCAITKENIKLFDSILNNEI